MQEQFLHHIQLHELFSERDKILLTVSGGIDSMVMLDLFKKLGFTAGVAHVNFGLRGEDSDKDEYFVVQAVKESSFPVHVKKFDTAELARERRLSIQMAARELRYGWFEELVREHKYSAIATAHHLNDSFETILLNLVKGTGFDGIVGIPVRQRNIVRPMLFATRQQIEAYARDNKLNWREDSSNSSDYYQRNLIRNQVMPLLRQVNPNLEVSFIDTLARLKAAHEFARTFLKGFNIRNIYYDGTYVKIRKEELAGQTHGAVILWELLKDLGFNYDQCQEITRHGHQPGAIFRTSSHQMTVDRDVFMIGKISPSNPGVHVQLAKATGRAELGAQALIIETKEIHEFSLGRDTNKAQLDYDRLSFPLVWRTWQEGDRFVPLGMDHQKKVSDFLIDSKIPLPQKEQITVVESNGVIVWLTGMRIADPFKVTAQTKRVLVMTLAGSQDNQI